MARCFRWSELQRDLLEAILEKLDLADHARFASVCSPWRSVAVENPPINKPLYMALSHNPENLVRRFITSFVHSWCTVRFIGAGLDGWLVILIDGKDLFLLNKGFNSIIPLPPPPKYPMNISSKAVLSSSPPLPSSSSSSSSHGECTVVLKDSKAGLYYCRLGMDNSFSKLSDDMSSNAWDFRFYKGRLYVVYYTNLIIIFDRLLNKVAQLVAHLGDGPLETSAPYRFLISENKLLITARRVEPLWVFEFDQSESGVVRVEDINGNFLLLVNNICSLSITTKEHKEFRRDPDFHKSGWPGIVVIDTSEDSNKAKVDDPWPLFFVMFHNHGIETWGVEQFLM